MLLNLYCWLSTLKADRKGVTAMEYALLGSLIAVAVLTAVKTIGTSATTTFQTIGNAL